MPELPEVETLRRELTLAVKDKTIKSVEVRWAKTVQPLSVSLFSKKLIGNKILSVKRRGKMLIVELTKDNLVVHLKMTGQLVYRRQTGKMVAGGHAQKAMSGELPHKHTHVIISFTDESILYFNDLRKFGWMRVLTDEELEKISENFGIEALSEKLNIKTFKKILERYPKRKIKQTLLDQKLIAGIGNIYADESCFCAGILPTRLTSKITDTEAKKLLVCIKRILKLSISKKGTSSATYVQLSGKPGGFVPYLKVYGRKGEKCKRCDDKIERDKVVGRGTHFCKSCQK